MGELRAFVGFGNASGLTIRPNSVVCLDPPRPDIGCRLGSSPYLFELGEVTDEDLARRYSKCVRMGQITGGFYSQAEPLKRMIESKAQKAYECDGAPTDLVLYYWKQAPYCPAVQQVLIELRSVIHHMLSTGPFSRIWLYKHPEGIITSIGGEQWEMAPHALRLSAPSNLTSGL